MSINFPFVYRIDRVISFAYKGERKESYINGYKIEKTFLSALKMRDRMDDAAHSYCHRIVLIADERVGEVAQCKVSHRATLAAVLAGQHQDYLGTSVDMKGGAA